MRLNEGRIVANLMTAAHAVVPQLEPVQGRRRSQRTAFVPRAKPIQPERIGLACTYRQKRITAQIRVIIEIFVTQRESMDALRN